MKLTALLFVLFASASLASASSASDARAGFQGQMDAWNRGDLEGALRYYLDSPHLLFVSKAGVERGLESFAAAMRADFGGHPERMGVYSGDVLEARDLGPNHALLIARWSIVRDGKRLFGGVSTQVWQRIGAHWRIAAEHAS